MRAMRDVRALREACAALREGFDAALAEASMKMSENGVPPSG